MSGQPLTAAGAGRWARLAPLAAIILVRLALGLAYSQIVPPWEAFDEDGHFAYARYLVVHRTLLLRPDDPEADAIWEKFQPPLYYNLIAPVMSLFDLGERFDGPERNPYFAYGNAGVNYALHMPEPDGAEQQLTRALRAARAVTVIISALSAAAVYAAARALWPRDRWSALTAAGLYAFWPQHLFIGSMVTNDALVTALSAVALALAVRLAAQGFRVRRTLALAGLVGAALLAKINAASLAPVAVAALLLSLRPAAGPRRARSPAQIGLVAVGLLAAVAAALWALNSLAFVTQQVFSVTTVREFARNLEPGQGAWSLVTAALPYAFRTFVASFGWGNLETFAWVYWVWEAGAVLAAAGLAYGAWRGRLPWARSGLYALLLLHIAALLGLTLALAVAHQSIYLVPGRYLLPTLPAVVLLLVGGWRELIPQGAVGRRVARLVAAGAALLGWAILIWTLVPAYARPPAIKAVEVEAGLPQHIMFGDGIELIGVRGRLRAAPGDDVRPELCWQATAPIAANYSLFLEVVGPDGQGYGRLLTFPGRGNYPTKAWAIHEPFCETYEVPLGSSIPAPALAWLRVAWLETATSRRLAAVPAGGERLEEDEVRIELKIAGPAKAPAAAAHAVSFGFGGTAQYPNLRLTGYTVEQFGSQVAVTLRWEAVTTIPGNYSVFVHLRDTPEAFYAAADGEPLSGSYPTRLWEPGEVILDTHWVTLPAGPAPPLDLYVGLRNPAEDTRVAVFGADGGRMTHDEIVLETGLRLAAP